MAAFTSITFSIFVDIRDNAFFVEQVYCKNTLHHDVALLLLNFSTLLVGLFSMFILWGIIMVFTIVTSDCAYFRK